MDFFRAQDDARRRTQWLAILFNLSLITLLVMSNGLLYLLLRYGAETSAPGAAVYSPDDPTAYVLISFLIVLVVVLSSLFKSLSLRKGGRAVAEMLSAKLLVEASTPGEQRLLNVVEEMAIASGMPVPPVYIMEEPAINAFAAGHSTANAAIGVTRGAIEKLTRDELQGVIAHEFSHILHGDMRLNLRLIGWLYGIMVLGLVGQYLVRAASVSRRNNNNTALVFMGLGLVVLGASGSFFGSLIKAAISRQREFLADASAVQYTRNPDGIASALKRIAADTAAPYLVNPAAAQISHALFSEGLQTNINNLFTTHPAIEKRIKALDPHWQPGQVEQKTEPSPTHSVKHGEVPPAAKLSAAAAVSMAFARVGNPDAADIKRAKLLRDALPQNILQAARDSQGAVALISALMCRANSCNASLISLPALRSEILRLLPTVSELTEEQCLLLVNFCLSSLRQLSAQQYQTVRKNWEQITVTAMSFDGWLLYELVNSHLDRYFGFKDEPHNRREIFELQPQLSVFFSMLADCGHDNHQQAQQAFEVVKSLKGFEKLQQHNAGDLTLQSFQDACTALRSLKPSAQQELMSAITACVYYDKMVSVDEHKIMRTVCEILGCPLPAAIDRS